MSVQLTPALPTEPAEKPSGATKPTTTGHRPQDGPDDHLCSCGRLRERCVRDTVRALWR